MALDPLHLPHNHFDLVFDRMMIELDVVGAGEADHTKPQLLHLLLERPLI